MHSADRRAPRPGQTSRAAGSPGTSRPRSTSSPGPERSRRAGRRGSKPGDRGGQTMERWYRIGHGPPRCRALLLAFETRLPEASARHGRRSGSPAGRRPQSCFRALTTEDLVRVEEKSLLAAAAWRCHRCAPGAGPGTASCSATRTTGGAGGGNTGGPSHTSSRSSTTITSIEPVILGGHGVDRGDKESLCRSRTRMTTLIEGRGTSASRTSHSSMRSDERAKSRISSVRRGVRRALAVRYRRSNRTSPSAISDGTASAAAQDPGDLAARRVPVGSRRCRRGARSSRTLAPQDSITMNVLKSPALAGVRVAPARGSSPGSQKVSATQTARIADQVLTRLRADQELPRAIRIRRRSSRNTIRTPSASRISAVHRRHRGPSAPVR